MRIFIVIIFGIGFAYLTAANYSSNDYSLKCAGSVSTKENQSTPETLYLIVSEYRSWVGIWSDSDGMITAEIPFRSSVYWPSVKDNGSSLLILDGESKIVGSLSTISYSIKIPTMIGEFTGICDLRNSHK